MSIKEPKTEAEWNAHHDAHTLAEAETIKNDKKRLKAAQEAAKVLAEEATDRADGLRVISKSSNI